MTNGQRIETYSTCIDRLCQWAERNLLDDGAWRSNSSSSGYFSFVPFANHIGRRDWAYRVLRQVQTAFIDQAATLRQLPTRDNSIAYVPSWFVWGASDAGFFRISNTLADYAASFQSVQSGGSFGSLQGRADQCGDLSYDATTMSLIALACAGRIEASKRAADFLVRLYEAQPALEQCFYTDWHELDGLVMDDGPSTAILRWDQPKQHYYKMGLFVVALVEAYGATGSSEYLDLAVTGYRLTSERASDLWTNTLSHKMVWAAATLYGATGDQSYIDDACRGADHLITLQQPDGTFHYPEVWNRFPPELWESVPNFAFQIGLWLALSRDALQACLPAK